MKEKLKTCPFCGEDAFVWRAVNFSIGLKVSCKNGCVTMPSRFDVWFTSDEQMIEAWNKREPK